MHEYKSEAAFLQLYSLSSYSMFCMKQFRWCFIKTYNLDPLHRGSPGTPGIIHPSSRRILLSLSLSRFTFRQSFTYNLRSAQTSTATTDVLAPLSCCKVGSISSYVCATLPFVFNIKSFCFGCIISLCILAFPISETIKWFHEVSKSASQTA